MATAEIRLQSARMNGRRTAQPRRPAVLRLFQAERSEEIFPLLLEEIIALGNPRALVVDVNLDSGEVTPAAALKWPRAQMDKFTSALWMQDHPLVQSCMPPGLKCWKKAISTTARFTFIPFCIPIAISAGKRTVFAPPVVWRSRTRAGKSACAWKTRSAPPARCALMPRPWWWNCPRTTTEQTVAELR